MYKVLLIVLFTFLTPVSFTYAAVLFEAVEHNPIDIQVRPNGDTYFVYATSTLETVYGFTSTSTYYVRSGKVPYPATNNDCSYLTGASVGGAYNNTIFVGTATSTDPDCLNPANEYTLSYGYQVGGDFVEKIYTKFKFDPTTFAITYTGYQVPPNLVVNTSNSGYQSRFLSVTNTVEAGTDDWLISTDHLLFENEVIVNDPTRNPTLIEYARSTPPSSLITYRTNFIDNQNFSTSTKQLRILKSKYDRNGTFDVAIRFANFASAGSGVYPFEKSYLVYRIIFANNVITSVSVVENYNGIPKVEDSIYLSECSLNNFVGCLVNAGLYLFDPPQAELDSAMSAITNSDLPFIAAAYDAFSEIQDAVDNPSANNPAFAYNFQVAEAGIDVEMFSASTMTQLMGDAKPIFRVIALIALYIGFLAMLFSTIRNFIGFRVTSDTRHAAKIADL
jgi:hypothetical protein